MLKELFMKAEILQFTFEQFSAMFQKSSSFETTHALLNGDFTAKKPLKNLYVS